MYFWHRDVYEGCFIYCVFFFNDTATTEIYTLSLHDALPIYVVRNTPNVTGFIGLGTTPTPVDPVEIENLKKRMGVSEPKYKIDVKIGDSVKINDGPFKEFDGKIQEIDEEKGKIKVLVSIFGRETPVELDFLQVKKI